ncbi:hypothetical protein [Flavobacterium microcysteis]|uniref:UVR domain-containing protein n=1 Tax=Flavobacterium microcysteis TaxID=2596891 RepID=A0A501QFE1_9FLAO|nr:hypothetical protein [Flavobacterium microcysteis]TPD71092.1 hypothetical protein FJA49_04115 [Flavobacterium microcysteis]
MIEIFNNKTNSKITIDDLDVDVQLLPRHYEDIPYVIIELNNIDWVRHSYACKDCKSFRESFGSGDVNWHISYLGKTYRLNMDSLGGDKYPSNQIVSKLSDYQSGTFLTLIFSDIPIETDEIQKLLNKEVDNENYEKACILRDIIKDSTST